MTTDTIAQKTNALIALKTKYECELNILRDKIIAINAILMLEAEAFAIMAEINNVPSTEKSCVKTTSPTLVATTVVAPSQNLEKPRHWSAYYRGVMISVVPHSMGHSNCAIIIEGVPYRAIRGSAECAASERVGKSSCGLFLGMMAGGETLRPHDVVGMLEYMPNGKDVGKDTFDQMRTNVSYSDFVLIRAYVHSECVNLIVYNMKSTPAEALLFSSPDHCWPNTHHAIHDENGTFRRLEKCNIS